MSEQLHPGLHPDPDSLNAFSEGVLPEHERLQCMAHLAECSRCRDVVFLAQEPQLAPAASKPASPWRRWFAPVPVFAAAAAACVAVLTVWTYLRQTAKVPTYETVARADKAPLNVPEIAAETPIPKPAQTPARGASRKSPPADRIAIATPPSLPEPPPVAPPPIAAPRISIPNAVLPPALPPTLPAPPTSPGVEIKDPRATVAGISGKVTDSSGGVIPGATIKVRQLDGPGTADAGTDVAGQFNVAGLPAGRYELQITALGFRQTSRQVDVRPSEVAAVTSQLEVGSVTETVEVTAAVPTLQTESSMSVARSRGKAVPEGPRPLPSKLQAAISVTNGKTILAVDSAGALYVSGNSGRGWKTVKPVWRGKIRLIALADPARPSTATFELTTDSGIVWLSRNGARWSPAPPQR